jgi:DNA processing protein
MTSGGMRLTETQRRDWLRLIRSEGVGPRTFRHLLNRFGGAGAALDALPGLARKAGRPIRLCTAAEAEQELRAAERLGIIFLASGEPGYPAALQAVDGPPPLIAARGVVDVLSRPAVSIVGSRNASAAGLRLAEMLARDLAAEGFLVVSGLARGIDARAHEGSLAWGTAAVLAGGLQRVYPQEHEGLLERIMASGCAVSEMPLEWEPRARDFPRRNRIVAGLSLGTVVVEAARRSGSLITARFSLDLGREVFAVPGSPLDPRAEGTNDLLKQGATLVTSARDIVDVLAPIIASGPPPAGGAEEGGPSPVLEPLWDELDFVGEDAPLFALAEEGPEASADPAERIVALLGPMPVELDELVRAAGLPPGVVRSVLVELDLAGRLERHGGNLVSLAPAPVSARV